MQSIKTWAGIDVSAQTLVVRRWRDEQETDGEFANDAAGHRALIKWLGKAGRVGVEATGVYHLQLALALRSAGVELMVINPRVAKDYARSLSHRSKTDRVDAGVLLDYVRRREFRAWQAPSETVLELREIGRRLTELVHNAVDEKNRLHAKKTSNVSKTVIAGVKRHLAYLEREIKTTERAALELIRAGRNLDEQFRMLVAAKGIGKRSAILLLTELAVLDPTMTVREIVAYAGLDPRVYESGTSVHKPPRISKVGNARLRAILYMIALPMKRYDRGAQSFAARLVGRGKKPIQALVALMRKILHGVWIVMQRRVPFDNKVLFAASLAMAEAPASATAASQPKPEENHPKGRSEAEELREQLESLPAKASRGRRRIHAAA